MLENENIKNTAVVSLSCDRPLPQCRAGSWTAKKVELNKNRESPTTSNETTNDEADERRKEAGTEGMASERERERDFDNGGKSARPPRTPRRALPPRGDAEGTNKPETDVPALRQKIADGKMLSNEEMAAPEEADKANDAAKPNTDDAANPNTDDAANPAPADSKSTIMGGGKRRHTKRRRPIKRRYTKRRRPKKRRHTKRRRHTKKKKAGKSSRMR